MNEFEKEIGKILGDTEKFSTAKAETLRKEIVQMWYDKNLLRAKIVFFIFFIASIGMMLGGYTGLRHATNTKEMLSWVIFFMIGFNSTILMKLWYWVVHARINLQKDLKQLQLQIAELKGQNPLF